MKKLIVIANEVQACGKTTVGLVLDQYLSRRQFRTRRAYTNEAQELPLSSEHLDVEGEEFEMQQLADVLQDHDAVILDCATDEAIMLAQSFRDHGIEDVMAEVDCEMTLVLPVCDDAEVLRGARMAAKEFAGLGDVLVVRMPLAADVAETFVGSDAERMFSKIGAVCVEAPLVSAETLESLEDMDLDLPLALTQRGLLPRFLIHQLLQWEVAFGDNLREIHDVFLPVREKETDHDDSAYGRIVIR